MKGQYPSKHDKGYFEKKQKQGQIMAAKGIQLGAGSEDCIRGP